MNLNKIQMEKINLFYEKHFFTIWYAIGLIPACIIYLNPITINKAGVVLTFIVMFGAAIPLGAFIYIINIILNFILFLFITGISEKSIEPILTGIWLGIGLLIYLLSLIG